MQETLEYPFTTWARLLILFELALAEFPQN